uniref:Uncharacterized protein n=1 Tax=Siphoviridae sp. ctmIh35 TaxID=2827932 RepID=A0A8S5T9F3_9CAUD|nr:MAG TPA: hypothetical protein [Siphoviridae sp. ctmIh35]DAH31917.1 MAG TPA: hypothetical protein [Caudoviricetes sp.]DAR11969.1 MAG TPA: hypothetical protein [Bacteriophage sp.]
MTLSRKALTIISLLSRICALKRNQNPFPLTLGFLGG